MKERINKTGKVIKLATSGLLLAALMIVNVQVGLSDSDNMLEIFNLKSTIYTPAAVASGNWGYVDCGPAVHDVCRGDGSYICCKD